MPPTSHPSVSSEMIDGTQYSVQRHRLTVWPTRAGEQTVPAITARFAFKRNPLDTDEASASVTTEALPFSVQLPPGADNLGTIISARDLTTDERWDNEPGSDSILAGTAFKRTITFTAPDIPGMVLPPFPAEPIDGLGVYSKQQLLDQSDRGSATGVRQQVITYVCQQPGQYTIPAVRFTWFDIDANELQTIDFPARTLNVIANPAMATADPAAAASAAAESGRQLGLLAALLSMLVLILMAVKSPRFRKQLSRAVLPFRPIHLQPLHPGR
jgi:hypothetical protein